MNEKLNIQQLPKGVYCIMLTTESGNSKIAKFTK
jgi:hypothetical protein